jgi:hypothetical protein
MTASEALELESQLIGALEIMFARYERINALADQMLAKQQRGQPIQQELQTLQQERESLQELERQVKPTHEAYRKTRATASDAVKLLTDRTAGLVKELIGKIAKLEDSARESFQRLSPEVNQSLRGQQMKQAYGNSKP